MRRSATGIINTVHHRPLDAKEFPRFAGIRTFMRAPHTTDLTGVDAAVVGIPFDTATSFRSGARFGPEAIRSASALIRAYHPVHDVNVVETLSIMLPVSSGTLGSGVRLSLVALAGVLAYFGALYAIDGSFRGLLASFTKSIL